VNALISFFILFFLFEDGRNMLRRAYVLLPLRVGQVRRLYFRIAETLQAIVYGSIAMAALQGILTGVAFWILGLSSPILWAIVTTLCAFIPAIGTGFVLVPAISMLLFSGHWIKALVLLAWGLIVVHPIDNVVRPYLIGEQTKLSTLLVFFAHPGWPASLRHDGRFHWPNHSGDCFGADHFPSRRNTPRCRQLRTFQNQAFIVELTLTQFSLDFWFTLQSTLERRRDAMFKNLDTIKG
jgi:hypothetical protein